MGKFVGKNFPIFGFVAAQFAADSARRNDGFISQLRGYALLQAPVDLRQRVRTWT